MSRFFNHNIREIPGPGEPRSQIFVSIFLRASWLIFFPAVPFLYNSPFCAFFSNRCISFCISALSPISCFPFPISRIPYPIFYSPGEHLMNSLAIIQQSRSGVPGRCSSEKAFTSTSLMVGWMTCDLVTGLRSCSSVFMR